MAFLLVLILLPSHLAYSKKKLRPEHGIKLHSADTSRGSMTRVPSTAASALYWCEKLGGVDEAEDEILERNLKTLTSR